MVAVWTGELEMCEHEFKDLSNDYRIKRECIKCGTYMSYDTLLGEQKRQEYIGKIMEFLQTEEGKKRYKGSRLEKYVQELEGILHA